MKPFVKWAGGKRQILSRINEYINDSIKDNPDYTYIEPFLGGGAVFFDLLPKKAIINDLNSDLINAYKVIQSNNYLELCDKLESHKEQYLEDKDEYYYNVRQMDRTDNWPDSYTDVYRASRMIFLNRTCYNGLYRVNSKGQFNTPIGRYNNPTICDRKLLTEIHNYLSNPNNDIKILCGSYEDAINESKDGDVIYIDPPYDYEDDDGFTKYQMKGFTFEDFISLKKCCDKAIDRGSFVIISNNATEKVCHLFEEDPEYIVRYYDLNPFTTLRTINCQGENRKTGKEIIIYGMKSNLPLPQANDMNKVIKLIMSDEDVLTNKEKAKELINVTTERQVAYYLSALMFLKYINQNNEFTDKAKKVKNNINLIKEDIFESLICDDLYKYSYNLNKDEVDIIDLIVEKLKGDSRLGTKNTLSESTLRRRASSINSWINWMHKYKNDKEG